MSGPTASEAACSRHKGDVMDEQTLPQFASRFLTVGAWRKAMLARGFTMPLQLCHGLSQAMTCLNLTFPEAFRLLWHEKKIIVAGLSLIYDHSAYMLWDKCEQPPTPLSACPTPPDIAWHRDVLALVPSSDEILRLEAAWQLTSESSLLEH